MSLKIEQSGLRPEQSPAAGQSPAGRDERRTVNKASYRSSGSIENHVLVEYHKIVVL
jgi:hypothetical protein